MDSREGRLLYEFGDFQVDATLRRLLWKADGRVLPLNARAFDTLLYLVEHPGELLEKATLMKAVWPNVVVEENNLSQSITVLRRVLGESPEEHRFIVTVSGRGYRFVADVKKAQSASPGVPPEPRPAKSFARIIAWGGAAISLALITAVSLWLFTRPTADSTPAATVPNAAAPIVSAPATGKQRLAILPFENLSPDPANAFFADGLHEEILSTIAQRVPSLEVISRTTMMTYRSNAPKALAEVARELGATHVIEGSVRREARKVRLTLQLIDARTDAHLWSQNYDRTLTDALTLQRDVAGEVAAQLSLQIVGGTRPGVPPTRSPEAYDLYLKAQLASKFLNPFVPVERFREVDSLLTRAIALDPSFALAYAHRATFRGALFAFNYDVSEEQVRRVREDVDAGLRLAPHEPMVLAAEALYWSSVDMDLARALSSFESAEVAGLADPMFLAGKSFILVRLRRVDEAVKLNEHLIGLDPGNPFLMNFFATALWNAGRSAEALRVVDRGLVQFPEDASLRFSRALLIFSYTGRTDEWRAALDRVSETTSPETMLDQHYALLTIEHRYAEMQRRLDGVSATSTRVIAGPFFGVGQHPIAEYRGWTALFLNYPAAAATQGRAVLDFVAKQKETKANVWYLRLLTAEGLTFLGQRERAIAAARETLELMPQSRDAYSWYGVASAMAAVYAWSGAQDEAVVLLEELSTARPGGGPAWITRDPTYAVPLARNPRYQKLVVRLEAEMRDTKLQ